MYVCMYASFSNIAHNVFENDPAVFSKLSQGMSKSDNKFTLEDITEKRNLALD